MTAARLFPLAFVCCSLFGVTPDLEITLTHNAAAESATRDQLQRVLIAYDLSDWLFTRNIAIDQNAAPHSHPVLTLDTRRLKEDQLLLSTFVHEQYHWFGESHPRDMAAAIAELKAVFPHIAVGEPEGAGDERSSYIDAIACFAEWQKMRSLVGNERAHQIMAFWTTDHCRAIYRLVLDHEDAIRAVVNRHGLYPRPEAYAYNPGTSTQALLDQDSRPFSAN